MAEKVVNGFMKGMSADMHYSALDNQQYLYAENIRPISSGFSTTGAIENIKGNSFIGEFGFGDDQTLIPGNTYMVVQPTVTYGGVTYNAYETFVCTVPNGNTFTGGRIINISAYGIPADMYVIGGVELRDIIVLFTTNNTRSQIYTLSLTGTSNSELAILTLLYDDEYNIDHSRLNFNVDNRVRAVARYETPNIQKVYWTDGINPLRYLNINKHCTVNGEPYVIPGDYWGIDKFELLPKVILDKPLVVGSTTGTISTGMVFYAYQLYIESGAESAMSYISDPVHVTSSGDYDLNDLYYEGDGVDPIKSKGFQLEIDLRGNTTFNRLKLIRVHYESYNQVPKIYVAADIPIDLQNEYAYLVDTGSIITELTPEEFAIDSTEIFICQELASKDNILFAANIEKKTFNIDDFDARAVRFRKYTESTSGTGYVYTYVCDESPADDYDYLTTEIMPPDTVRVIIHNFREWAGIPTDRYITTIDQIRFDRVEFSYKDQYQQDYNAFTTNFTINHTSWDGTTLLIDMILHDYLFDGTETPTRCVLRRFDYQDYTFRYSYTASGAQTIVSDITDMSHGYGGCSILRPTDTSNPFAWHVAGWHNYKKYHDGVNYFNNPDNDGDTSKEYMYKSDGIELGAEGPNIIVSIEWADITIDDVASTSETYHVAVSPGESYSNYSSPLNIGKLSWQRDEVYRLFISFKNTRGQDTEPKWICDLRMPKFIDNIYGYGRFTHSMYTYTHARRLFPVVEIRPGSWPSDAVSAQIYRVPRHKEDRQVVTQCLAYPFTYVYNGWYIDRAINPLPTYDGTGNNTNLVKLVSPEINITKNIASTGNDFLEYVHHFGDNYITSGGYGALNQRSIVKCRACTPKTSYNLNDRTGITDMTSVMPLDNQASFAVAGISFHNYNDESYINAKGSTGLVVKYGNNSWSAEGKRLAVVNYKTNCWNSQYGGLTYENRQFNNMVPCSDIMKELTGIATCNYGDTFINYFDVSTLLYDMTVAEGNWSDYSKNESVYVPLESSINCNLRHGGFEMHKQYNVNESYMLQEELGAHMFTDSNSVLHTYNQTNDMYKYNTVYSQQPLVAGLVSIDESRKSETVFDTQIRASLQKINGEYVDSWTKFGVNETIEVDSLYGPLNALLEYGHSLYFWQDKAFGALSVNSRSLIQDNNTAQLVLGTGGVLDRYDYISTIKGCEDKFSVVAGVAGIYWVDRRNRSINRFAETLSDLALQKGVKSLFMLDEDIIRWSTYLSVHDKENNEVIFTLANYINGDMINPGMVEHDINKPFTLCFNETIDAFTSTYSFIPYVYIPFKNIYLTNSIYNTHQIGMPANLLFVHNVNENVQARNNFYGLYYNDALGRYPSKVRLVFNPHYLNTKVFDNLFINGEVRVSTSEPDLYTRYINETIDNDLCPIHDIMFYNSYQNSDVINLIYKTNLERRERIWTTVIPRNAINSPYDTQYNDPTIEPLTPRVGYTERLRDKYLVCEFNTVVPTSNTESYRFIIENIGATYRQSHR